MRDGFGNHESMSELLVGYATRPGAGVTADDPSLKASQASTDGALSVFETSIDVGPPLHVHDREDECFYVLEGELSIRCGDDFFDAKAGSFVFLPRGRSHRFSAKDGSARLLLIAVPAGIEHYFRDMSTAPAGEERRRIAEMHGIHVVQE